MAGPVINFQAASPSPTVVTMYPASVRTSCNITRMGRVSSATNIRFRSTTVISDFRLSEFSAKSKREMKKTKPQAAWLRLSPP